MRFFRRLRLVAPTDVAALRPGRRAVVRGRVVPRDQIVSPARGEACVWFRCLLEDWREPGYWAAAGFDEEIAEFYVEDRTGRIVVVPFDARVELSPDAAASSVPVPARAGRRAVEARIVAGDLVEVDGWVEAVEDQLDEARAYRERPVRLMLRAPAGKRLVIRMLGQRS